MAGWLKRSTGVVTRPAAALVTRGDRIDRVLTHRVWGTVIFALVMLVGLLRRSSRGPSR